MILSKSTKLTNINALFQANILGMCLDYDIL